MELHNSPSNTYTAPTCTLTVSNKAKQLSHSALQQPPQNGDFTLEIDHPDRGEFERTTLHGDLQALDRLQAIVSTYITELIAKFPLPTADRELPPVSPSPAPEPIEPTDRLAPESPTSGLMQNLPGLRNRTPQPTPIEPPGKFGFWHHRDRQNVTQGDAAPPLPSPPATPIPRSNDVPPTAPAIEERLLTTPYLTGGNRSLDHQLHLGDLATPASGAVQILSAIQLFDLALVLDEYAATKVNTSNQSGTKVHAQSLAAGGVKRADVESTAASLSRLPNLPRIAAELDPNPVYYRQQRSRGWMSVLPWAAAAALLIGVPAILLGSGENNPLKELVGKVKQSSPISDRADKNKNVALRPTDTTVGNTPSTSASATLPKPWQAQSVKPPQNTPQSATSGSQNGQKTTDIGTGTLPASLGGTAAKTAQVQPGKGTIAPNPLTTGLETVPSATGTAAPTIATKPSTVTSKTTPAQASKATPTSTNPGNVSISTQPILIPQDLPRNTNSTPIANQAIPPQVTPAGDGINPAPNGLPSITPIDPQTRKKVAKQPAKPKKIANNPQPQASSSTIPFLTPSPTIDPKTYQPNPNLITPQPSPTSNPAATNITGTESPAPQIVPDRPLQSNNGKIGADGVENSSLQDAKRYFQGKWKADPTQSSTLQYVLDLNGKNGVVRSVNPQGEAATVYLKQTKLIKPGQKIVSPVAGSSDQKIRVLLQPDGNVDTFVEP